MRRENHKEKLKIIIKENRNHKGKKEIIML